MSKLIRALRREVLIETYNAENSRLFSYLQSKPLDVYNHYPSLQSSWGRWEDVLEELGISEEDLEVGDYEACHKISDWFDANPDDKEEVGQLLTQEDPYEAPSWAMLDVSVKRLLPATTWLVHWTDHAEDIAEQGFRHGVDDIERLQLTTYRGDRRTPKEGYCFAFQVSSSESSNPDQKYGKECVIFQSSGVEVYHGGDEEDQVIFWGPGITTKPIAISEDPETFEWRVLGGRRGYLAKFKDVDDAFAWVIKHRRYL